MMIIFPNLDSYGSLSKMDDCNAVNTALMIVIKFNFFPAFKKFFKEFFVRSFRSTI